ncbi:MAG TPA: glycosyltransferase [Candidatus Acidoferrum sp.]|jgi:glycosyltransferase involved in cell wall biosynthesis|nr:glycosyltransferase [Candidatus Acidoferrum sp.]
MAVAVPSRPRVSVDGKFFRLDEKKFYVKGLAYGPFAPNAAGQPSASPDQTAIDFAQIRELGANLIRVYDVPAKWFLDLAAEHRLKVLIDIPWNQQQCFLDTPQSREEARDAVRRAVFACGRHPAVFAYSVANEIPADVVRWSGARAVEDFIDDLIQQARRADPNCLCTYTNFPPTEFLHPQNVDFVCFNVYLHHEQPFKSYLARLQMQAEAKPLLLGEFGIDSLREGETRKCEMLAWQIEGAFRGGLAGAIVFSFTDDWWRGGRPVEDWQMGLTTPNRRPKESFWAVQKAFRVAPLFLLRRYPKVSVVVASFNGDRTLKGCLDSLEVLNYPNYEIILVDDGSSDSTPQIASQHPKVRYFRHEANLGLSVARNTGIAAANGELVAFTDADCRADEDWLYYLVGDLLNGEFAGIGGPNLLPPEDSAVAAAVMVSPGGPAHVMLTDRQAEHIPGCNMAFFKWALDELGGFDPIFRQAGDDVDLCWRLQQAGYKIGFSPAGFVWHYRRSTVGAYLRQQHGYGEAEALLVRKHPEYFNRLGGSLWRGRIYTAARVGLWLQRPIIYRGLFGSAGFQSVYSPEPALTLMFCTTLEYHVLVTLPLWIVSVSFHHLLPLAIASLAVSLGVCAAAGAQAPLAKTRARPWSRPLVTLLYLLQPIVRGWARYQGRLLFRPAPLAAQQTLDSVALRDSVRPLKEVDYWSAEPINRLAFIANVVRHLDQQGWPNRTDIGWGDYDVEINGSRWTSLQLATVSEDHSRTQHLLRCRLRARWSLAAKVAFWSLAGLEVLALGFLATQSPWLWLVLFSLPLLAWWVHREHRTLRSMLVVFLDVRAKEWTLTKVRPDSTERPAQRTARPAIAQPDSEIQGSNSDRKNSSPAGEGSRISPHPGPLPKGDAELPTAVRMHLRLPDSKRPAEATPSPFGRGPG